MTTRRPLAQRIAIIGGLLGAFASAYLLVDYVFGSGICLTGSGCDVVRASSYAYPLGIPMPLFGLGFYVVAIALILGDSGRRIGPASLAALGAAWSFIGVAVMAGLTFVELVEIQAVCSWCLMSATASLLLAGGAIAAWRRADAVADEPVERSSHARRRREAAAQRSHDDLRTFTVRSGAVLGIALVALLAIPALVSGRPADVADPGAAAANRPRLGSGPVEVVVYSDFQCPACAVAAPILGDMARGNEISLVYRYFPLSEIHPNAVAAARAGQAAHLQGRFWELHDALFASQAQWAGLPEADAVTAFATYARSAGLDMDRWRSDLASDAVRDVVASDRRDAQELRLSGTPTIFIEGQRYGGPLNREALEAAVRTATSS
jgi:protein-disulfide isomerase